MQMNIHLSDIRPFVAALLLPALTAVSSYPAPVSPEQALAIASQRSQHSGRRISASGVEATPRIAATFRNPDGNPAVYAVNVGRAYGGFTLVAADDNVPLILGYSDSGSFDPDNLPPALMELIEEYTETIRVVAEADTPADRSSDATLFRHPVEPLVSTNWDQGYPYNIYCPTAGEDNEPTPVGCVAIAMAQVMHSHQWPPKSTGSVIDGGIQYVFDTDYDWSAMPLTAGDDSSIDPATDNMARMLLEVGRSLFMVYMPSASGTNTANVPRALTECFSYDPSASFELRSFYTSDQWEELLYNQLQLGLPMVYSALSLQGGHAFIADGYDGDGYFHINWGWNGMSDGYFLLSDLTPSQQGIGGTASGYLRRHGAVINIRTPFGGRKRERLIMTGSFEHGSKPGTFRVTGFNVENYELPTGYMSLNGQDFETRLGVRIYDMATSSEVMTAFEDNYQDYHSWEEAMKSYTVDLSTLPDGCYYVHPVGMDRSGVIYNVECPVTSRPAMQITVTDGNFRYARVKSTGELPENLFTRDTAVRMVEGEIEMLHVYSRPMDCGAELVWSSDNPDVATVTGGLVCARGKGTATITASVADHPEISTLIEVTVSETAPTGINTIADETVLPNLKDSSILSVSDDTAVYNLQGIRVADATDESALRALPLPSGLYLWHHRKIRL